MTKENAMKKINQGSGRMPAFAAILNGKEEAILAYLYETSGGSSRKDSYLSEIENNKLSVTGSEKQEEKTDTTSMYLNITAYSHCNDQEGRPAIKPPWGELNAINLNTGEYVWKIPVGNHPDLQEEGAPITGSEGSGGPMVTAGGLVFIGGTRDKKFRAFDKDTGDLLWETELPGVANATPCTFWSDGKQYIATSVAGDKENPSGYVIAFALPGEMR